MPKQNERIKLTGDAADLFRDVQDELAARYGYRPTNAETTRTLLAHFYREELQD